MQRREPRGRARASRASGQDLTFERFPDDVGDAEALAVIVQHVACSERAEADQHDVTWCHDFDASGGWRSMFSRQDRV